MKGAITIDDGLNTNKIFNEITISRILFLTFGGNIKIVNPDLYKYGAPDFIWNNKLWEIKSPTKCGAADGLI